MIKIPVTYAGIWDSEVKGQRDILVSEAEPLPNLSKQHCSRQNFRNALPVSGPGNRQHHFCDDVLYGPFNLHSATEIIPVNLIWVQEPLKAEFLWPKAVVRDFLSTRRTQYAVVKDLGEWRGGCCTWGGRRVTSRSGEIGPSWQPTRTTSVLQLQGTELDQQP